MILPTLFHHVCIVLYNYLCIKHVQGSHLPILENPNSPKPIDTTVLKQVYILGLMRDKIRKFLSKPFQKCQ